MRKSLTGKQKLVLTTIEDLRLKSGKSPTLNEIREALGYAGISSIQRHIDALKKKGYLSYSPYQARSLEVNFTKDTVNIPLVGNIAAGTPILAMENVEAYIPYEPKRDKFNSNDYFFLRVVGDSMNLSKVEGKNIDDSDYVLVRKQNTANSDQIVVALVGEEATIKKFEYGEDYIILKPQSSNPNNKPFFVFEDLMIQGIVVDVLKLGGEENG